MIFMELTNKQQEQENEYAFPYHWMIPRYTDSGRLYFGYLGLCASLLPTDKSVKVLDAGCGDARFFGVLRDKGYKNLHGVDYSESALSFARLLVPQAEFHAANISKMPFPDDSFDAIFCIETVEHLIPETIPAVMAEFRRVLKPGGQLVITVPSLLNGIPKPESKHYQHFSVESLSAYIEPHLKIEEMIGQDYTPLHPLKIFYKLIDNPLWDIKPLRAYYNARIWPRFFNRCDSRKGRRLVAVSRKNS